MNFKNIIKIFLSLIAILLLTTVMPVTYADNTLSQENNQEFQATHAELVNYIMYLQQTLSDFDDYHFDEALLEKLQTEVEQALIMTQRSTVVATIEYSLGFLRVAYSSLLEDAIKNEIVANQLLIKELGELTKENVTSPSWSVLQKQLESSTDAVEDILLELDQLGIKLNNDSDQNKEQDENFEVLVIDLPDLTSELREIFDTLIKIRQALVFTHHTLQEDVFTCPRNDDECLALSLQVARFELLNLLIDHDVQKIDPLDFENATQILTGDDLKEILKKIEQLL